MKHLLFKRALIAAAIIAGPMAVGVSAATAFTPGTAQCGGIQWTGGTNASSTASWTYFTAVPPCQTWQRVVTTCKTVQGASMYEYGSPQSGLTQSIRYCNQTSYPVWTGVWGMQTSATP